MALLLMAGAGVGAGISLGLGLALKLVLSRKKRKEAKKQEETTVTLMENITTEEIVNILVVGLGGVGKSTLISSLLSCITHKHDKELAEAGKYIGGSFTMHFRRYEKAFKNCSRIKNSPAVFYDMPGLLDQLDERFDALLRCILQGAVPPNKRLDMSKTKKEIEEKFQNSELSRRIDRVIFVHSCTVDIPENLLHTVVKVCKDCGVTLFGVITHIDHWLDRKSSFSDLTTVLGTEGSPRCLEIELYHQVKGTGQFKDKHDTNLHLYRLWQMLLNTNYMKYSEMAEPNVLRIDQPGRDD